MGKAGLCLILFCWSRHSQWVCINLGGLASKVLLSLICSEVAGDSILISCVSGRWFFIRRDRKPNSIYFILFFAIAQGVFGPQPGIEPMPPAVEAWSLNHWTTREVHGKPNSSGLKPSKENVLSYVLEPLSLNCISFLTSQSCILCIFSSLR